MDTTQALPGLIGAGILFFLQRVFPHLIPSPAPAPAPVKPTPANPSNEPLEFLEYVLRVKAGLERPDDKTKETLRLIKTSLSDLAV